jgi:ABC-type Fe3+/spermidine/putrescine transport system ATPase subunit
MPLHITGLEKTLGDFNLNIDLEVQEGEIFSLLGPSGCGKTTVLRLVAGFLSPDAGTVSYRGREFEGLGPADRNTGIVFQDYALFPHMSVASNIAYGPKMRRWDKEEIKTTVDGLLELTGLEELGNRKVPELSGGEQQRIALARALAPRPDILLLDEPLSALDAALRLRLRREIKRIQRYLGITTIYVTHDQEEALSLSDRVAVMRNGRILQTGTPRELYERPADPFVGGFIGTSTMLPARLLDANAEMLRFTSAVGTIEVDRSRLGAASFPGAPAAAGVRKAAGLPQSGPSETGGGVNLSSPVVLFFRPEACTKAEAGRVNNVFSGTVETAEFQGRFYHVELKTEEQLVKIQLPGTEDCAYGQTLRYRIDPSSIHIIPQPADDG